jgi:hypothetical protein
MMNDVALLSSIGGIMMLWGKKIREFFFKNIFHEHEYQDT